MNLAADPAMTAWEGIDDRMTAGLVEIDPMSRLRLETALEEMLAEYRYPEESTMRLHERARALHPSPAWRWYCIDRVGDAAKLSITAYYDEKDASSGRPR